MTPWDWADGGSDGGDPRATLEGPARDRTYESFGRQGIALPTYGDGPRAHRGAEGCDLGEPVANPIAPETPTGTGPKAWQRRDARIHDDVCLHLNDDELVDLCNIEVVVHQGEVILTGIATDLKQRDRAIRIAELTRGVVDVISRIRVVPERTPNTARR